MLASTLPILVGMAMLGFSLYKIWEMVMMQQRKSASQAWPVAAAEVVSRRVVESRSGKSGKSFHPEIIYKYTVMGQEFEKRILLPGIFYRQSAQKAIEDFGNTFEVRYNPDRPKEHVSETDRISVWNVLWIAGGLILGLLALLPLLLK